MEVRPEWIFAAAAASRCSGLVADKPILAIVAALVAQVLVPAARSGLARAQGNDPAEVAAASSGLAAVKGRVRGPPVGEVAVMLLGICRQAE